MASGSIFKLKINDASAKEIRSFVPGLGEKKAQLLINMGEIRNGITYDTLVEVLGYHPPPIIKSMIDFGESKPQQPSPKSKKPSSVQVKIPVKKNNKSLLDWSTDDEDDYDYTDSDPFEDEDEKEDKAIAPIPNPHKTKKGEVVMKDIKEMGHDELLDLMYRLENLVKPSTSTDIPSAISSLPDINPLNLPSFPTPKSKEVHEKEEKKKVALKGYAIIPEKNRW